MSQYSKYPVVGGSGGSGVSSLNTLTGDVTLAAGTNVTLTPVGQTITISASGGGGSGTVTSVGLTAPAIFSIAGTPVTTAGTLAMTLVTQAANIVWAGPTTGAASAPTFRALVAADLPAGTGTVTSVAATVPSFLSLAGSPITASGTLAITLATQSANAVFAGPTSGGVLAPTFRSLVAADIPSLSSTYLPLAGGTLTGTLTSNVTPAASTPGVLVSGTPYVAGSATTNKPAVLLEEPGATSTAWSTAGTYLGVNAKSTFTGNLLDAQVNGVSRTKLDYHGQLTVRGDLDSTGSTLYLPRPSSGSAGVTIATGYGAVPSFALSQSGTVFFEYAINTAYLGFGYSIPDPKYPFHFMNSTANTTPLTNLTYGGTDLYPVLMTQNTNSTAGNYGGIANSGSSHNFNGYILWYNDTQTSGSEDSHCAIATAAAGTRSEKLTISKLGQVAIQAAGTGLSIKEGSNCKQGTAVLVAGTVTVSNTSITASSRVFLTHQNTGGTVGVPSLGTVVAGTSFVINSSNAADTSTIAYFITEPS